VRTAVRTGSGLSKEEAMKRVVIPVVVSGVAFLALFTFSQLLTVGFLVRAMINVLELFGCLF
jgi:hypothetical protein